MVKSNSIFIRLLLTFIIIIIPIYVFSIAVFTWSKRVVEQEITSSTASHVSHLKNVFELEVQKVNMLQNELINDRDIINFIYRHELMPRYDYYTYIAQIQRRLIIIRNSNILIDDALIHFPQADISISSNKGLLTFNEQAFLELLHSRESYFSPLTVTPSSIYSFTFFPVRTDYSQRSPDFLIEIYISRQLLLDYLNQFESEFVNQIILYDYNSGLWLNNSHDIDFEMLLGRFGTEDTTDIIKISGDRYLLVSDHTPFLNMSLLALIPLDTLFKATSRYTLYLMILILSSIGIITAYALTTQRAVIRPVGVILKGFKELEDGVMDSSINFGSSTAVEFRRLFSGFNNMVKNLNLMIDKVYRQELYAKKAQLKRLQAQINSHFLYNSHFILNRMIKDGDNESASLLSAYMGEYFKYLTRNTKDEVTLKNEIKFVSDYLRIQVIRFSGRLDAKIGDPPEEFMDCEVPRMILQPVVENIFEHGFKRNIDKLGSVLIDFEVSANRLDIIIQDNNDTITDEDITQMKDILTTSSEDIEITGMINIHRRLQIVFGENSGIFLERSDMGGLKVIIRIFKDQRGKGY